MPRLSIDPPSSKSPQLRPPPVGRTAHQPPRLRDWAGLTDADVATVDQVVAVLVEHPRLMQRPVVVKGDRAIIGRPKDRVAPFVRG